MKKNLITLLLCFLFLNTYSENLNFNIHGAYDRSIKLKKLIEANSLIDIREGYPTSWVTNYISVELAANNNGKEIKALGTNEILTNEQKSILKMADIGTSININVKYFTKNAVTAKTEIRTMNFSVMVVPEIEAEYRGGYDQLTKYFKENAINKIFENNSKELPKGRLRFTVNEEGYIINAHVLESSKDSEIDKLLIDVINRMPKWNPAENSKGVKVKQEFELSFGNGDC